MSKIEKITVEYDNGENVTFVPESESPENVTFHEGDLVRVLRKDAGWEWWVDRMDKTVGTIREVSEIDDFNGCLWTIPVNGIDTGKSYYYRPSNLQLICRAEDRCDI